MGDVCFDFVVCFVCDGWMRWGFGICDDLVKEWLSCNFDRVDFDSVLIFFVVIDYNIY